MEPEQQFARELQELRERLCAGNPDLYRHLALYLQVLRQVLPDRVERACFHLAAQRQPHRYPTLAESDRKTLHRRIASLVRRCTSLLTVEQLATLAAQIARERQRQERRQQQEWLQRFMGSSGEEEAGPPLRMPAAARSSAVENLPPGSVNLDGSPGFPTGLLGLLEGSAAAGAGAGVLHPSPLSSRLQKRTEEGQAPADPLGGATPDLWSGGQLPEEPLDLLQWLDGIEAALSRRLRNLSHAINVELLRVGLSGSLLPVSLLDAVLGGQLEPHPAPPNLLRLRLPFPAEDASPLQVMALLLRRVDLELEEPRLRTCRRRLQQHRQEVRRMAQQFHRLQRRRVAQEAEQLWLRDRHESLNPPD